ncbi:hypothetical protein EJD97_008030 [Solanum chilense]|uniref:Retrotransposon gag domain-containing protein n=1 Tax=Solanum chilense TaxID=4083 RepID=A0A6N2AJ58_SOLCI|nr:hypothetical protein EJD97_008030 [Solanum chilense]
MPNTRRGREILFPYDHELERTLCNMNQNLGINDDDPNQNISALIDVHDSDGPLVLPPLPPGHTFVVTSSLMQIITARGLKVFPLSLTVEVAIWFTELPFNSIFTWNQLRDVFLPHYYPVSKKLNHKDRVNNFVTLPGESVSSSWDRCTSFFRGVPNHRIDDVSVKEYFYWGHDYNNKAVLDTIAGGSYWECPYDELPKNRGFLTECTRLKLGELAPRSRKPRLNLWNGPYVPPQNREVTPRDGGDSVAPVEDMLHKMMRRFDVNDENIKDLRSELAGIGQKVDTHAISIKQIELQMAQLSATTIDPPMSSKERKMIKDNDKVIEGSGEVEDNTGKDVKVPIKLIPMPRPTPPFPQRLVKKTKDGKYHRFITMLKQLSINVPLVEALEQMPGYAKFMKDLITKKRSITFEDDDRMKHCSAIATRSLVQKKEDLGAFTILCTVGPIGIPHDVLVKVESFIFPVNFVILDCEVDFKVSIILGRPFLATGRALVDMEKGQMKFWLNNKEATFNICRSMKQNGELQSVSAISYKEKMKKDYDQKSEKRESMVEDLVLLDNSRLCWLPGKLKSKWTGPYLITQLFPHGAIELETKEGVRFKVHGERIKLYFGHLESANEVIEACHLDKG